jgi:hypothetical protein
MINPTNLFVEPDESHTRTCRSALWPGGDDGRSGALFGARAGEAGGTHFKPIAG